MSQQAREKRPFAKSSELTKRIEGVRKTKGLTQEAFAKLLGDKLSGVQIHRWEKGREKPTRERLIDIAREASNPEDRLYFLKEAGVDLSRVKGDMMREWTAAMFEHLAKDGPVNFRIPLIECFRKGEHGILLEEPSNRELTSLGLVSPSAALVAAEFENSMWSPFATGDLLLIDRSVTEPQRLRGRLAALFFDPFPIVRRGGRSGGPGPMDQIYAIGRSVLPEAESTDPTVRKAVLGAERPGLVAGWIFVQFASGSLRMEDRPPNDHWRLVLSHGPGGPDVGYWHPLTDWQTDRGPDRSIQNDHETPLAPLVKKGIWIAGSIEGWIGSGLRPRLILRKKDENADS